MTYIYAKRPPRAIEYPLSELLESMVYTIRGDDLNFDDSSPHELFDIPANTVIVGIGWRTVTGFADSGVQINPWITLGDTAETAHFGKLTWAEMRSSDRYGFIPVWYESTAAMKINAVYSSGGASTAGVMELWLMYRPQSGAQRWTNRV